MVAASRVLIDSSLPPQYSVRVSKKFAEYAYAADHEQRLCRGSLQLSAALDASTHSIKAPPKANKRDKGALRRPTKSQGKPPYASRFL